GIIDNELVRETRVTLVQLQYRRQLPLLSSPHRDAARNQRARRQLRGLVHIGPGHQFVSVGQHTVVNATRQRQKQAVHPQQHGLTSGAGGLTYIHASYSVTHLLAANVMPESAPDRRQLRRTPVGTVPTRPRDSAAVRDRAAT